MSTKIISLFLLTAFFLAVISANALAGDLRLQLREYPSTVEHDIGSFAISFDLTNLNKSFQAENFRFYAESNKQGSWQLPSINVITADSTQTLTAVFNLQPYQSGDFVGAISVNGTIDGKMQTAIMPISRGKVSITPRSSVEITNVGSLTASDNSTSFKIKNKGNEALALNLSVDPLEYKTDEEVTFVLNQTSINLDPGQERNVEVGADIPSDLELGEYTTKIRATSVKASAEAALKISKTYCKYGRVGSDIKIVSIKDKSSGTDWEWGPLDEVEIEVKAENNGDDEEDITVEIQLYDPENDDVIDFEDGDTEQTLAISDDDSEIFTFNVKVPVDISEGTYRLYVKAYIDGDEDVQCTDVENSDAYIEIDMQKESREVIINDFVVLSSAECKETVEVYADVYNTGSKDEDRVKVSIYNKDLGIDQESSSFELDEGDSKKVYFDLHIPDDATEKTYTLEIKAFYDYRKSSDEYREESSVISKDLKVEGNCEAEESIVAIAAVLESEAKAGKEMIVKATLTNTGTKDTTCTLTISGNDAWSDLSSIQPSTISLKAGESKESSITLDVNKAAAGDQSFIIKALHDGETTEQPVSVFVEKAGILTGFTIGEAIGGNWFIWLIVAINVILIILIIVVAIRASRR